MVTDIRLYRPTDLDNLYRICLLTGADGKDASPNYADSRLLGHYYAAPYAVMDPLLCLVVSHEGVPAGYILGTDDSANFKRWSESNWFPQLRNQYVLPEPADERADARLVRLLHQGYDLPTEAERFPAHLHIDLLPEIQGRGLGRQLTLLFLDMLRARACTGVHLGVSSTNPRAMAFYESVGFHELSRDEGGRMYGLKLMR